jgi:Nif11 domain
MSVQTALQFIRRSREDKALQSKIQALGTAADLDGLVEIGAEVAITFTVEELQAAFRHDWRMRWMHYNTRHRYIETPLRAL